MPDGRVGVEGGMVGERELLLEVEPGTGEWAGVVGKAATSLLTHAAPPDSPMDILSPGT